MKIAIAAEGQGPSSSMATVFGRCSYILVTDSETQRFVPHINPGHDAAEGSGLLAARFVVDQGVKVVIAPKVGRLAQSLLDRSGLRVHLREGGTAGEALTAFLHKEQT